MTELTIEPYQDEWMEYPMWTVYEHSTYERGSVLEGQPKRSFKDQFDSLESAKKNYPEARVCDHSTKVSVTLQDCAPSWFDPMNAGERWDEDY